jgi:hypothetical protein
MSMPSTWPLGASGSWPWQASSTSQASCSPAADQGVLAVGAEAPVGSGHASGAGPICRTPETSMLAGVAAERSPQAIGDQERRPALLAGSTEQAPEFTELSDLNSSG